MSHYSRRFRLPLLPGASYVNIYYQLLHSDTIPERDREFCVNLAALCVTGGITLSSIFIIMMDNTFLQSK
jgi:hypothetical protein